MTKCQVAPDSGAGCNHRLRYSSGLGLGPTTPARPCRLSVGWLCLSDDVRFYEPICGCLRRVVFAADYSGASLLWSELWPFCVPLVTLLLIVVPAGLRVSRDALAPLVAKWRSGDSLSTIML